MRAEKFLRKVTALHLAAWLLDDAGECGLGGDAMERADWLCLNARPRALRIDDRFLPGLRAKGAMLLQLAVELSQKASAARSPANGFSPAVRSALSGRKHSSANRKSRKDK
jgi:hypothetical protein